MVQLGAAALGRLLSNFGLVEHEMYPAVWQGAELAEGTEVSSPKHISLKCAWRYGTVSSFSVQGKPNPAFISGLGVTSFLFAMPQ